MSGHGTALVALTALVAVLLTVLAFAVFRLTAAARAARQRVRSKPESALLSSALHDAVTALKAQERAMSARAEASEQLAAQVFDSLTAGLLVLDGEGRVTTINPAGRRLLSIAPEAGVPVRDVLAHAPALVDVIDEGLATQRAVVRRSIEVSGAHESRHLRVTVSPFGEAPARRGAICLVSDQTTIVELEQQLQAKAALAALGEMTAGLAHEFRNGLATIHGYSRLMDPDRVPPDYRACVEGIRQETETLGRVVTNFLGFARPESLALAPVDLQGVIERAADELRPELPGATVTVSGSFGTVAGDDILLRQTFANLIRNAVEAAGSAAPGPCVAIEGRVDPHGRVSTVVVDDNGHGVPDEHRSKIFQPFFTTRSRGSGLGLAIVRKIVLLHNGRISVGCAPGGGARFELAFPLAEA